MTNAKDTTDDARDELWDANGVARYLKVSRSWVYQKSEEGALPCLRVGGLIRFDPAAGAGVCPAGHAGVDVQAPASAAAAAGSGPTNGTSDQVAGGVSEPPQPAASGTVLRLAAPFGTHWYRPARSPMRPRPGEEELERILAGLLSRGERI